MSRSRLIRSLLRRRRRARPLGVLVPAGAALLAAVSPALESAAPATGATRPVALVFGGYTSKAEPFELAVNPAHSQLTALQLRWSPTCASGAQFTFSRPARIAGALPAAIAARQHVVVHGAVSALGNFKANGVALENFGATNGRIVETITGHVGRSFARGSFRAQVTLVNRSTGRVVGKCDTGTLGWRASGRPGVVLGGATSTGNPVVVEVSPDRTTLRRIRIPWSAYCVPRFTVTLSDVLQDFPLKAGKIAGGHFRETLDGPTYGERDRMSYKLGGAITGRRATGTLRVRITRLSGAGKIMGTCDSGALYWAAGS